MFSNHTNGVVRDNLEASVKGCIGPNIVGQNKMVLITTTVHTVRVQSFHLQYT